MFQSYICKHKREGKKGFPIIPFLVALGLKMLVTDGDIGEISTVKQHNTIFKIKTGN